MNFRCEMCGYNWDYSPRSTIVRKYVICPVCRANIKNPQWGLRVTGQKNPSVQDIKKIIIPILLRYNVKKAFIFGSFARGEQKLGSDLDILVDFDYNSMKGLDYVRLWKDLESSLQMKVDLVSKNYVNKLIKNEIEKEEIRVI